MPLVLAIDQGTTSTKALIVDEQVRIVGQSDAPQEGAKTRDLGGDLGTKAFADAVMERPA